MNRVNEVEKYIKIKKYNNKNITKTKKKKTKILNKIYPIFVLLLLF